MVLRVENFNIFGVHWKIWLLRGLEKPIYRGWIALKGGLGQFADLRVAWQERGGGGVEGGWYPNVHYGWVLNMQTLHNVLNMPEYALAEFEMHLRL